MPKNRFSWHRDDGEKRGGWENAEFEFTQVNFSNPVQKADHDGTEETAFCPSVNSQDVTGNDKEAHTNNNSARTLKRFHDHFTHNRSHYLCTLLPSRKAYRENPGLDLTMSRKKTLKQGNLNSKATMSLRHRSRICGSIQYQVPEDEADLQMGNIQEEGDYWDQLLAIKNMAAPMSVKMMYKMRLQDSNAIRDSDSAAWKTIMNKNRQKLSDFKDEFKEKFDLWHNPLKVIEGHYGTGIVSYFVFLRWLLLLNLIMFAFIFFFIVLPPVALKKAPLLPEVIEPNSSISNATSVPSIPEWYKTYKEASANYTFHVLNKTQTVPKARIQDFIQGTGWMEITYMFFGAFSPNNLVMGYFNGAEHWYRLPLAYLLVTVVYLFICMIMMVQSMVNSAEENLVIHEGQFHRYFNLAFSSWDFCVTDPGSADLKQMSIYVDIQSNLKEDAFAQKKDQRSNAMKVCLYATRFILNLISLGILVGAGYLIYYVVIQSTELLKKHSQELSKPAIMLIQFLTPITITVLNLALPMLFKAMVKKEQYRPDTQINLTLIRSVFVRLASLAVLMATFAKQVSCNPSTDEDCVHLPCWETYVGQEMYKLIIVDFVVVMFITMFVETLRRFLVVKFSTFKLSTIIGKPEFDIAKNVLDLIYGQTVCWLGVFYCPMLPAIGVIKNIIFFYSKKYTLLYNCQPAMHAYKSKSNTFYILVLLLSFFLSCIPLVYSFSVFQPSKGCGPFRLDVNMWEEVIEAVDASAKPLRQFVGFIFSAGFVIPLFIILCFLIYYFIMVKAAYKELMSVFKERLKEEGKDKQYLLARLTQLSQNC